MVEITQSLYENLFKISSKFKTIEVFIEKVSDKITQFNDSCEIKLESLLQFILHEYSQMKNVTEHNILNISNSKMVILPKHSNDVLLEKIIKPLNIQKIFVIKNEEGSEGIN